jgi:threonine dehydrogenase-like Zn-dependent dehydrogenase
MNTTTDHIQVVGAGPFGQITGPLLADLLRCTTQIIARRDSLRDCDARNRFGQQTIRVGGRHDYRRGLARAHHHPFDHRIPAPARRGRPRNPPAMGLKRIRHRQAGRGDTAITEAPAPAADFRGREPDYGASR